MANTNLKVLILDRFSGGISSDKKRGSEGSFNWARSLDIRTDPTSFSLLPKTAKEGTAVADLVKFFEPIGTDMYAYGDAGKIYKRTSTPTWSVLRTVSGSSGNGLSYFPEDDYLYYSLDSVIGRYGPIGGTPAFSDDFFSDSVVDLDQFLDASGQVYAPATSIAETATHRQTFVPGKDPQKSVQINVATVGTTADWTVTVHDPADNVIATKTIANASMATGDVSFTFATPWRPVIGASYHFHVTVSNTTGTPALVTGTASDLETADFHTFYQILVTDVDFHPMCQHINLLCVGNERYVATWDGIPGGTSDNYQANRIVLPAGWKVRDLESTGEYLAIVAWKGTSITDFDESMIFFWDGYSSTYNFFIPIKEGVVTSAVPLEGRLYWITNRGDIFMWDGTVTKLHTIPGLTQQTYVDVYPDAMRNFQGLIRIGVAGTTNSAVVEQGVYTYGTKTSAYPESLSFDYPISTGTRKATTLKIGALGVRGNTLFISWDDNGTYGVDVVTTTAAPFATGVYESLIVNDDIPWKEKLAQVITVEHTALAANESIQIGYDIDSSGTFTTGTANTTTGSTNTRLNINNRFKEIQIQVTVTAVATTPDVTSISFAYNPLDTEDKVG